MLGKYTLFFRNIYKKKEEQNLGFFKTSMGRWENVTRTDHRTEPHLPSIEILALFPPLESRGRFAEPGLGQRVRASRTLPHVIGYGFYITWNVSPSATPRLIVTANRRSPGSERARPRHTEMLQLMKSPTGRQLGHSK